jgi:hypothetical protein
VPRYNDFREKLHKRRVDKFEDLTPNPEWNQQIRDVSGGDIDKVNTLKSVRFFMNDYSPEICPPPGID